MSVRNLKVGSVSIASVVAVAILSLGCGETVDGAKAAPSVEQATAALNGNNVQLLRARDLAGFGPGQGITSQNLVWDIAVKNLGFAKQVFVHLKDPCGSNNWIDVPGSFIGPSDGTFELWRVGTTVQSFGGRGPFTFAIEYVVNGNVFWDNNNGNNYVLPNTTTGNPQGVFGVVLANGTNVLLSNATASGTFSGTLNLLNLPNGFQKNVFVRYTTNNWATQTDVPATYVAGPNANGVETWSFTTNANSSNVVFAISYTAAGSTFWDNNFGQNYTATPSGSNGAGTPIPVTTQPFPPPIISCS